jgi:catechol 2,3-dioxygenase-like lactoylglutathione lyase family enzyme
MGQRHRMPRRLAMTAFLVDDYDEAILFFVGSLGFTLREDTALGDGKRWVVVAPPGAAGGLLLARAVGGETASGSRRPERRPRVPVP